MKIALLTDGIWPYVIGGMQKHSYLLCKHLANAGIQVHLYYTADNDLEKSALSAIFEKKELENITGFFISFSSVIKVPGHYLMESYKYSKAIFDVFRHYRNEYDLIYIQGFSGWYTLTHKKDLNIPPCLVNFHGLEMFQPSASLTSWLQNQMFRPFVKKILKSADYVQSLGGKLTDSLNKTGIPENKIILSGIGIEDKWLSEEIMHFDKETKRIFTFIGRYERRKGISELTCAIRNNINLYNAEFHFIGPIPADKMLTNDNVYYYGLLQNEEQIKRLLDKTDFLLVPSYSEGMPTVILEAMARSCAIIATDVGAVSELVSNKNGILVKSPKEIEKAIKEALQMNREIITEKQKYSRSLVEKFTWNRLVKKMIETINSKILLKEGRKDNDT